MSAKTIFFISDPRFLMSESGLVVAVAGIADRNINVRGGDLSRGRELECKDQCQNDLLHFE